LLADAVGTEGFKSHEHQQETPMLSVEQPLLSTRHLPGAVPSEVKLYLCYALCYRVRTSQRPGSRPELSWCNIVMYIFSSPCTYFMRLAFSHKFCWSTIFHKLKHNRLYLSTRWLLHFGVVAVGRLLHSKVAQQKSATSCWSDITVTTSHTFKRTKMSVVCGERNFLKSYSLGRDATSMQNAVSITLWCFFEVWSLSQRLSF